MSEPIKTDMILFISLTLKTETLMATQIMLICRG